MWVSVILLVDDFVSCFYVDVDVVYCDFVDFLLVWDFGVTFIGLDVFVVDVLLVVAGFRAELLLVVVELWLMGGVMVRPLFEFNVVVGCDAVFSLMTIGLVVLGLFDAVFVAVQVVYEVLVFWWLLINLINWLGCEFDREWVCVSWLYGQ